MGPSGPVPAPAGGWGGYYAPPPPVNMNGFRAGGAYGVPYGAGGAEDDEEEMLANAVDLEDENALKDTWVASARSCTCCKGFIYACSGQTCDALGVCFCTAGELLDQEQRQAEAVAAGRGGSTDGNNYGDFNEPSGADADAEMALRDTWVAAARDCTCCKGYVYGCTAPTCRALGVCVCTAGSVMDSAAAQTPGVAGAPAAS